MSDVRVVLFDLDDTLVHFDDYWKISLLEAFRRHPATRGIDPDRLFEVLWEKNVLYEQRYHAKEITIWQYWNWRLIDALAVFGREIGEAEADGFTRFHHSLSESFIKADPALAELLSELKRKYAIGLVTNGTAGWQYGKLEAAGLDPLFEPGSVVISEEVGWEKPAPEIFVEALGRFGAKPEEAVFVGDSWKHDIEGAAAVGIRSIWFNKRNAAVPEHPLLIGTIADISELRRYL